MMVEYDYSVLAVDDDPAVTEMYAKLLGEQFQVDTATCGSEAFEAIDDETDVVLLDRQMPGMTGDEVLQGIRTEGYDCRVAMLTGVDPTPEVQSLPFDAYLTKPIDGELLRGTVRDLLDEERGEATVDGDSGPLEAPIIEPR